MKSSLVLLFICSFGVRAQEQLFSDPFNTSVYWQLPITEVEIQEFAIDKKLPTEMSVRRVKYLDPSRTLTIIKAPGSLQIDSTVRTYDDYGVLIYSTLNGDTILSRTYERDSIGQYTYMRAVRSTYMQDGTHFENVDLLRYSYAEHKQIIRNWYSDDTTQPPAIIREYRYQNGYRRSLTEIIPDNNGNPGDSTVHTYYYAETEASSITGIRYNQDTKLEEVMMRTYQNGVLEHEYKTRYDYYPDGTQKRIRDEFQGIDLFYDPDGRLYRFRNKSAKVDTRYHYFRKSNRHGKHVWYPARATSKRNGETYYTTVTLY